MLKIKHECIGAELEWLEGLPESCPECDGHPTTLGAQAHRAELALKAASEKFEELALAYQKACLHEHIVETDYAPSVFDGVLLHPLRICTYCGVEEEGWSFYTLLDAKQKVERDEVYNHRKPVIGRVLLNRRVPRED